MSRIIVIAGPPGVGKSTSGTKFVAPSFEILNEDEMAFKYRTQGYPDYKEQAIHRLTQIIRTKLIGNEDFALELNLGYSEHYEYVLSAKKFNAANSLHLILFHTDDLEMCIERAKLRFETGRHYVKPDTIREMHSNTIPLLEAHFDQIDSIQFINANSEGLGLVSVYDRQKNSLKLLEPKCPWFYDEVYPFITARMSSK